MINMKKVILICGKICSGKSYYAAKLKEKYNAVILSTDEVTFDLINNEQGEFYNVFAEKVNLYLRKKAAEIAKAGADVILDWGFWTNQNRKDISDYFASHGVDYEWHYIDIDDELWHKYIKERNQKITEGNGGSDFYVDEGLFNKVQSLFEVPEKSEIDVWYDAQRETK